jgi:glycosyltransferase involved in cell wall biosynthesis
MKLGYLIPEFPAQTHIFFWREIRALRLLGEEVSILSTRRPAAAICRHEFAPQAIAETHYLFPPELKSMGKWTLNRLQGLASGLDYLKGIKATLKGRARHFVLLVSAIDLLQWATEHRIDHIHGHSCADAAHVLALSRHMGGPSYSLTLHGDLDVYGRDHQAKMVGAEFVCAVGKHLCQQIVERVGLPEQKVLGTFMGVDTSRLATLGQDRSMNPGALRLVTVARLHANKGHLHALSAIHRARQEGLDVTYTIAGEGPFHESILAKIGELGIRDHVKLTGSVSEEEVFQLLSEADAFALTSFGPGEAWPVSVMEAMGSGLPVIASIIGATPEMISSGVDGFLVPQRDDQAIFGKIAILARDISMRERIGSAARVTAQNRFDVAVSAGLLRNAIRVRVYAPDKGLASANGLKT